jgi:hypothetical protein
MHSADPGAFLRKGKGNVNSSPDGEKTAGVTAYLCQSAATLDGI